MKSDPKVLKTAYASIFKGDMGKIVMNDLKDFCHINMPVLSPGKPDVTAFNDGKRWVFLRICQLSNIDLDKISQRTVEDTRSPIL